MKFNPPTRNINKTYSCLGCGVDPGGQEVREELPFASFYSTKN